jgi:hypothetical protein
MFYKIQYSFSHNAAFASSFLLSFLSFNCAFRQRLWYDMFERQWRITDEYTTFYSGRCPAIDGVLPTIPNGYRSNVDNVQLYSDGTAAGYYDISCEPGYALNTAIGGRITCLASGSWSQPLPQCNCMLFHFESDNNALVLLATGRCSIPTLFEFLQNAAGIRIDQSRSFIYTDGVNDNQALGGSNITVQCATGYINVGGSLTIICTKANNWTPLPNCTYNSSTTTTTAAPPLRCPVTKDTWIFTNGYMSNTKGITVYDDNTAKGIAETD